jgi:hypothetical protein
MYGGWFSKIYAYTVFNTCDKLVQISNHRVASELGNRKSEIFDPNLVGMEQRRQLTSIEHPILREINNAQQMKHCTATNDMPDESRHISL